MGKMTTMERKIKQLMDAGWVKSPISNHMISPGGDRRMSILDIAQGRMATEPTPPYEFVEWQNWMVEHG
jgi:hypothetical protein